MIFKKFQFMSLLTAMIMPLPVRNIFMQIWHYLNFFTLLMWQNGMN